ELRVSGLLIKPLQLAHVFAADYAGRVQRRVDRLAGNADVQPSEIALRIKAGGKPALRDGAIEIVRLVLLSAPYQLNGSVRKRLVNRGCLTDIILCAAAPAKAAAQVQPVDFAFCERQSRCFR